MPTSQRSRVALGLLAAVLVVGLGMLWSAGNAPRYRSIATTDVASETGVQLPDRAYQVQARVTIRGQAWTAVSFHIVPGQYEEALTVNGVSNLVPGAVVLHQGDDLGLRWRPLDARRVAGATDRLPDGRVRRIQVIWGATAPHGSPPNPEICIVIVGR